MRRPRQRMLLAVASALTSIGLAATLVACAGATPNPPAVERAPDTSGGTGLDSGAAGGLQDPVAADRADVARPVSVRIPSIGVSSRLVDLELDADGELEAPTDFDRAGWYTGGVRPGEIGPAIIAGHIDSRVAPAVFARLSELRDGDVVRVRTADGERLEFAVDGRAQSAKSRFPTADVYGRVPTPQLRLITCAGPFDSSIGHYEDNLVIFATLLD